MAQHKMKVKASLPKGVKSKVKKPKPQGVPKRGHAVHIAPKRACVIAQEKVQAEVTKVINEKNEDMLKGRADTSVGRKK